MRQLLIAALFATAAFSADMRPAAAATPEAPWCAVLPTDDVGVYLDCRYPSIEACRPNILAGMRGICQPNPNYQEPERKQVPSKRPQRH